MSENIKNFLNQDYDSIKKELLASGKKFEDPSFPANDQSINIPGRKFAWARPHQICENPEFIVEDVEPDDLDQGSLGNCWLISSLAAVASVPERINMVVPPDQSFKNDYCGIFRFRFWRDGHWYQIVVDDQLPVQEYNPKALEFCKNKCEQNEMFGPLLEKAYAKFHKNYNNLDGGTLDDGLTDLTGGICESYMMEDLGQKSQPTQDQLWMIILKTQALKSIIGSAILSKGGLNDSHRLPNGLVPGHGYTVIAVYELVNKNGKYEFKAESNEKDQSIRLLKIRNPHGQSQFVGEWNQNSNIWNECNEEVKSALQDQDNGQFIISYEEYLQNFDILTLAHINLDAFASYSPQLDKSVTWITDQKHGEWKKGETAGGSNLQSQDFWSNPQFLMQLNLQNQIDEKVSLILSLSECGLINKMDPHPKYLTVFKVKEGQPPKKKYLYSDLQPVFFTSTAYRQLSSKLDLSPASYVIIPSLENKNEEAKFLLRFYIEGQEDLSFKGVNLNARKKEHKKKVRPKKDDQNLDPNINPENYPEDYPGEYTGDYPDGNPEDNPESYPDENVDENYNDFQDYYDDFDGYYEYEYDEEYFEQCEQFDETENYEIPEDFVVDIQRVSKVNSSYSHARDSRACSVM